MTAEGEVIGFLISLLLWYYLNIKKNPRKGEEERSLPVLK